MIKARRGLLEDPHPVDQEKLMKGTIVTCVKCQKVMFALPHRRLLLNTNLFCTVMLLICYLKDC